MQKKRLFRRLAITVLVTLSLFLLYKNLGADEKTSVQKSKEINLRYEEALNLYQQGQYVKAREKLNHILKLLKSDPYVESWRKSRNIKPTPQHVSQMIREIEDYHQEEKQRKRALSQEIRLSKEARKDRRRAELAKQKEERAKQQAELKAQREAERKARQEELVRRKEERLKRQAELKAKREEERQAQQAELAKQKEESLRQKLELKAQELELARQERLRQKEELRAKKEQERQVRQEELARQKEERLKRQAELKAKHAEERQAKQAELAKQKEERAKRLEELKAKREEEHQAKQAELARKQEERAKQLEELRIKREEELKARQAELAKQKEERAKQQAELKAKQEEERQAKQAELAKQKEERAKRLEELKAKREEEHLKGLAKEEQEELKTLKQEKRKLQTKVDKMKRSIVQDKAFTEVALKKKQEDKAKIRKIEELWRKARILYSKGMYEEAINNFEAVIRLEGNPRIKYTPYAKDYIEKAREHLIKKEKTTYSKELERMEREMMNEVLKLQVPPYIEPPVRIEEKLEPVFLIEPPLIRKKLKELKITIDFDKVGLQSAMQFFSQESGINFIASQMVLELAPVVSASFKETTLDEVTKYITKSLGLVYRVDKELVWIAHPEEIANEPMETRVYYLNKGGGLFTEFSPISTGTTETSLGGSSAQINKVSTVEDTLKEIIPWPDDAKLTYDKRLNALIVRNTPQNLQTLEDVLYSLDIEPCQVLIEARFLEVDITDTQELGLEWKFAKDEDFAIKKTGQADGSKGFKHGFAKDGGVDFTAFSRVAEGMNLTYKGVLTKPQFEVVLHALEETKKIKTLSSPRITTLNNQLASIKVVDEWIYPTRYEYEVVQTDINGDGDFDDANETTYKNVPKDFLRRDVGILLKVIPAVGADKTTINLSLIPEVSEATADAFSFTGGVTLPKFTSRNLSTTVVVNSGDTVVLGGLIKESRTNTITKVPILGNIPLLGVFFRKNSDSIQRKNLLIFVTARVLSSSGEEVIASQK